MAMRILSVTTTTVADLGKLIATPYPEQRDHEKAADKKDYLFGELKGDQLIFHAVTIKENKLTCLVDGYHRVTLLLADTARLPQDALPYLVHHEVDTMEEARYLYGQFNSLRSAKKSNDQFDGGLRAEGLLSVISSHLVLNGGRATAIQLAYGRVGSKYTTPAVRALKDAIVFVDELGLRAEKHVIGGQLGAYFAISAEFSNAAAESFIRKCHQASFRPRTPRRSDLSLLSYHVYLDKKTSSVKTGGNVNSAVFRAALGAFAQYYMSAHASLDGPATPAELATAMTTVPASMTLGEFKTWAATVRKFV